MKIVFYTASLGKGGAERVLNHLSNYFSGKNDVTVILERPLIEYKVDDNVKIITLEKNLNKSYNFITKKLRFLTYYFKLKKHLKKIKPDVIVGFLAVPAFTALLAKPKKSKMIVSVRNDPKSEYTTFLKKFLMKSLYPKADGFVFQTKEAQDYFKNIISCKQTIIFNPISSDFLHTKCVDNRENKIVSVGRLHWQKNYPLLIDAFEVISKKYNNYKLFIFGEGEERKKIEELIDSKNLSDKIVLAGNVNNVKDNIINSKLFVMTSDFEGMPNSLIEAMVLGLPVISTDCPCGGPRELILNEENGMLVEVGNKEALVNAMDKILSNEKFASYLGDNAKNIIKKVDPNYIDNQWEEFIFNINN